MLVILPKALEQLPATEVFPTLLLGIPLFFVLRSVLCHCHTHDCEVHDGAVPVVIGDGFTTSWTARDRREDLAAARYLHRRGGDGARNPAEVGDFAILLHAGYRGARLMLNVLRARQHRGALAVLAFDCVPAPTLLLSPAASFLRRDGGSHPGLHCGRTDASSLRQILRSPPASPRCSPVVSPLDNRRPLNAPPEPNDPRGRGPAPVTGI
jgi:hypothetical protein